MPRGRPVNRNRPGNNTPPMRQRTPGVAPGAPQQGQSGQMRQLMRAQQPPPVPQPPPEQQQQQVRVPRPIPLTAETEFPDQPVTTGMATPPLDQQLLNSNAALLPYLPDLEFMANSNLGSETMRGFVQYLKSLNP